MALSLRRAARQRHPPLRPSRMLGATRQVGSSGPLRPSQGFPRCSGVPGPRGEELRSCCVMRWRRQCCPRSSSPDRLDRLRG
eukprot:308422-Alexandrium_andersonii.AAC.1